ncbi:hypothetical protein BIW11_13128 [Tropilaelaps mercedesae]|uniref:Uncharacterized protein n=1 Tax=Tropilaelaps mercedesae TaxID=418985 RepID=A0A1V9X394_9ACAR|nr:hypothetical protein BIW11_13128 [Tropilaelaps mercedesae]
MKPIAPMMSAQHPYQVQVPGSTGPQLHMAGPLPTTGYPGYPYYPSTMPPPQQFMQPNVLASQFPPMQPHAVPQVSTPTQIPAPIQYALSLTSSFPLQQMAAPFQPGIAPPPLTPQSQTAPGAPQQLAPAPGGPPPPPPPSQTGSGAPTPRPPSAVDSERPQSASGHHHQGPPQNVQDDPFDDQYDHRCSLCIAAWGFSFLCGLTGAAGTLFVQQGHTVSFKTLGFVLLSVSILLFLSTFLFLPASSKYSNKMPVHRQCLPFLLAVIASGEICWVVYLINEGGSEGKGILVALAAFLALFWLALWKIMCLRCCCHRRRICAQKKMQARLEQQQISSKRRSGSKRRASADPEEFETDFHHVNTQVRETLRNRFNESILQQSIIQSAAPSVAIGGEGPTLAIVAAGPQSQGSHAPSAPPADTPATSHGSNNTGTLTTFGGTQSGPSAAVSSGAASGQTASGPTGNQVHDPPPYDAVYRRTPPPPYSTLV